MYYRITFAYFVLSVCFSAFGKKNYEPEFKIAVNQSKKAKVESLLTRKNKLPEKSVQEMLAWTDDIVEEKAVLDKTLTESVLTISGYLLGLCATGMLAYHIIDRNFSRSNASAMANTKYRAKIAGLYALNALGFIIGWFGPRIRLSKAYETKFAMEKACNDCNKKKVA